MSDTPWADFYESLTNQCRNALIPINVGLELTPLCNFNCKMCYIHLSKEEQQKRAELLSAEQWIDIAKQAYDMGTLSLTLSGGEVFTRPDFRQIYEALSDMGFMITILSNGYLINNSVIEWLAERQPHKVRITIYGASDETYKAVTGISDGYTVVTRNIQRLQEAGINVHVTMTIIKDNEQDLPVIEDYCKKLDIPFTASRGILNPLPGIKREVTSLRAPVLNMQREDDTDECLIPRSVHALSMCRTYRKGCWITWDGYMQLCPTLYAIRERISEFSKNWTALNDRLSRMNAPGECSQCKYWKYCTQCPGSILSESGNPEKINENCCKEAIERYRRIQRTEGSL